MLIWICSGHIAYLYLELITLSHFTGDDEGCTLTIIIDGWDWGAAEKHA